MSNRASQASISSAVMSSRSYRNSWPAASMASSDGRVPSSSARATSARPSRVCCSRLDQSPRRTAAVSTSRHVYVRAPTTKAGSSKRSFIVPGTDDPRRGDYIRRLPSPTLRFGICALVRALVGGSPGCGLDRQPDPEAPLRLPAARDVLPWLLRELRAPRTGAWNRRTRSICHPLDERQVLRLVVDDSRVDQERQIQAAVDDAIGGGHVDGDS